MTMTPEPTTTRPTLADPTPLRSAAHAAVDAFRAALGGLWPQSTEESTWL